MIRPKQAGVLLATGVLLPLLVLAMHPTGHDLAHDPHGRMLAVNHLVHGIAVAAMPLLLAGLAGLCAWLRWSASATLGFATYCIATACNLVAATMSGFVAPRLLAGGDADGTALRLLQYSHDINQAFAFIAAVATGLAFVAWAWSLHRHAVRKSALAALGALLGGVLVAAIASGTLRLDVSGILVATALQAAWLLPVAWMLGGAQAAD
jgi:hypothetical protein